MAGKAITRGCARRLDAFGEEQVFQLYIQHRSVRRLLKVLPPSVGTMSNAPFYAWLKASPERWERWQLAKAMIAQDLVEEALAIVDEADDGSVQSARLRSEQRRWMAERYDRTSFGRNPTVNVAVESQKSVGASFLEALKEVEVRRKERREAEAKAKTEEIPEAEFEVVEEVAEEQSSRTRTERSSPTPDKPVQEDQTLPSHWHPITPDKPKRRLSRGGME